MRAHDRAEVQLVDVAMTFLILVALMSLAPHYFTFTDMITSDADSFSALLLDLVVPTLFIALLLSVGVSARRGS